MLKKFVFALAGLAVVLGIIVAIKAKQFTPPPPFEFPPESVTTAKAEAQEWDRAVHAVGSLRADQGVTVASEGQGIVKHIGFESGARVQAGDVLVELDSAVERAQLAAAQAKAALADVNITRAKDLLGRNVISQSEFDAVDAATKQSLADVKSLQAVLDKKTMRAPFSGRVGIRMINLGQFLDRGNPIVTLQALDPIHVDFWLPQQRVAEIKAGYTARITTDARPGVVFAGKVTAISPEVDAASRTVHVEATLANADEALSPGMFVDVAVVAPEKTGVVAVPAMAIYYQPYGDTVFVAKETKDAKSGQTEKIAEQRFVKVGESHGDFVNILSGVKPGEEIVTTGAFKLSNGRRLFIDNSLAPKAELAPKPANT
ncbi:MAG: efflux RND transporter periplasmic adaptor subunit [Opitutae bacterium]|nr:efflux RND transporter periplasmic adaptor subunit [Opitutae bacterium]